MSQWGICHLYMPIPRHFLSPWLGQSTHFICSSWTWRGTEWLPFNIFAYVPATLEGLSSQSSINCKRLPHQPWKSSVLLLTPIWLQFCDCRDFVKGLWFPGAWTAVTVKCKILKDWNDRAEYLDTIPARGSLHVLGAMASKSKLLLLLLRWISSLFFNSICKKLLHWRVEWGNWYTYMQIKLCQDCTFLHQLVGLGFLVKTAPPNLFKTVLTFLAQRTRITPPSSHLRSACSAQKTQLTQWLAHLKWTPMLKMLHSSWASYFNKELTGLGKAISDTFWDTEIFLSSIRIH